MGIFCSPFFGSSIATFLAIAGPLPIVATVPVCWDGSFNEYRGALLPTTVRIVPIAFLDSNRLVSERCKTETKDASTCSNQWQIGRNDLNGTFNGNTAGAELPPIPNLWKHDLIRSSTATIVSITELDSTCVLTAVSFHLQNTTPHTREFSQGRDGERTCQLRRPWPFLLPW